ncbi:MAG TPA: polysaccharide deacetylase family protein [Kofleriaceae bacterium]|nr:polysaccharide deacetylase family protein [Kofleriaceae bacterium]
MNRASIRATAAAGVITAAAASATSGALAGCQQNIGDMDGVFYNGDDRLVHCAVDLDTSARNGNASIDTGLDRARDRSEVVELYAHDPGAGGTVSPDEIEHVLAGAQARGLSFVTYRDFAIKDDTDTEPGLALSFDDTFVEAWVALRPMFQQYHARLTFFISHYRQLSATAHDGLKLLAADGHDIEAHTVMHLRAPDYVEDHGLDAYLRDEMDPSIQALVDDGYEVHAFAYPYGARTDELDAAIAKRVPVIRSVSFSYPEAESPCPR